MTFVNAMKSSLVISLSNLLIRLYFTFPSYVSPLSILTSSYPLPTPPPFIQMFLILTWPQDGSKVNHKMASKSIRVHPTATKNL